MTAREPRSRLGGWALSATVAGSLLWSAAAIALASERQAPVLVLDLAELPPSAPAVAAVAEAVPQVVDKAPPAPEDPAAAEPAPDLPHPDVAPDLATASAVSIPKAEVPVTADLALPPPPEKPVEKSSDKKVATTESEPEKKPEPKPEKKPAKTEDKPRAKEKAAKKTEPAEDQPKAAKKAKAAEDAVASAPKAGTKAKSGGGMSPAAYAKAVMKKVRSTKRKSGAGKGLVVVGFSIGKDGSLAGVQVLQGSGNARLDKMALEHIRRSAPFPPPPEGAKRDYAWEFEGR